MSRYMEHRQFPFSDLYFLSILKITADGYIVHTLGYAEFECLLAQPCAQKFIVTVRKDRHFE